MTPTMMQFFRACLHPDPARRATAVELLDTPFIKEGAWASPSPAPAPAPHLPQPQPPHPPSQQQQQHDGSSGLPATRTGGSDGRPSANGCALRERTSHHHPHPPAASKPLPPAASQPQPSTQGTERGLQTAPSAGQLTRQPTRKMGPTVKQRSAAEVAAMMDSDQDDDEALAHLALLPPGEPLSDPESEDGDGHGHGHGHGGGHGAAAAHHGGGGVHLAGGALGPATASHPLPAFVLAGEGRTSNSAAPLKPSSKLQQQPLPHQQMSASFLHGAHQLHTTFVGGGGGGGGGGSVLALASASSPGIGSDLLDPQRTSRSSAPTRLSAPHHLGTQALADGGGSSGGGSLVLHASNEPPPHGGSTSASGAAAAAAGAGAQQQQQQAHVVPQRAATSSSGTPFRASVAMRAAELSSRASAGSAASGGAAGDAQQQPEQQQQHQDGVESPGRTSASAGGGQRMAAGGVGPLGRAGKLGPASGPPAGHGYVSSRLQVPGGAIGVAAAAAEQQQSTGEGGQAPPASARGRARALGQPERSVSYAAAPQVLESPFEPAAAHAAAAVAGHAADDAAAHAHPQPQAAANAHTKLGGGKRVTLALSSNSAVLLPSRTSMHHAKPLIYPGAGGGGAGPASVVASSKLGHGGHAGHPSSAADHGSPADGRHGASSGAGAAEHDEQPAAPSRGGSANAAGQAKPTAVQMTAAAITQASATLLSAPPGWVDTGPKSLSRLRDHAREPECPPPPGGAARVQPAGHAAPERDAAAAGAEASAPGGAVTWAGQQASSHGGKEQLAARQSLVAGALSGPARRGLTSSYQGQWAMQVSGRLQKLTPAASQGHSATTSATGAAAEDAGRAGGHLAAPASSILGPLGSGGAAVFGRGEAGGEAADDAAQLSGNGGASAVERERTSAGAQLGLREPQPPSQPREEGSLPSSKSGRMLSPMGLRVAGKLVAPSGPSSSSNNNNGGAAPAPAPRTQRSGGSNVAAGGNAGSLAALLSHVSEPGAAAGAQPQPGGPPSANGALIAATVQPPPLQAQ